MKLYFFIFFILLLSTINSYEVAKFLFEKSWYITGEEGTNYTLNATFLVNDSEQNVLSVNLSEGELVYVGKNLYFYSEGTLESENKTILATAVIETRYDPFIDIDNPIYSLPTPKNEIQEKANSLVDDSSIALTLISFTDWVHKNIEYDSLYSHIDTPEEVFEERKGVCTAYTSLVMAFLEYIGLEAKEVSGYADSSFWQPHAWAEAKINGEWLSLDATYNQIALLSSDHIKTNVGGKSLSSQDLISSFGGITSFSSDTQITKFYLAKEDNRINYDYELSNGAVQIDISNPTNQYVFIPFTILFPEGWGETEDTVFFLGPKEEKSLTYVLDPGPNVALDESYIYSVPFVFYLLDEKVEDTISYDFEEDDDLISSPSCLPTFLLFFLLGLYKVS